MSGPLAGSLSFLVPDRAEAALLAVCLRPERAGAAWAEWTRLGGDLDGYRSLLPLVDAGVREAGVRIEPALAARLAAARLHETLRWTAVRDVTADALGRLARAGLDPVAIQDVAMAATAYDDPALRHCRALEILVPPGAVTPGVRALAAAGYLPGAGNASATGASLRHADGLPVRLTAVLFPASDSRTDAGALRVRAVPAEIGGAARVPAPADALALLLGRAGLGAERRSLLWVCDAAALIERSDPEWERVVGSAVDAGLGLPIARMAEWLSAELGVPVPSAATARMAAVPARGREARHALETALECARADGRAGPLGLLARAESWRERARVARWTALPSTDRVRRSYPGVPGAALPLLYLVRPLLAAVRSVARRPRGRAAAPGSRDPGGGTAAARSEDPEGREGGRPSASPRSSE
jgi:hypothetical protein